MVVVYRVREARLSADWDGGAYIHRVGPASASSGGGGFRS